MLLKLQLKLLLLSLLPHLNRAVYSDSFSNVTLNVLAGTVPMSSSLGSLYSVLYSRRTAKVLVGTVPTSILASLSLIDW